MNPLKYENFILAAFELTTNKNLNKGDDPANTGNADYCRNDELTRIKSGISYAMSIYRHELCENQICNYDEEFDEIDLIIESVFRAENINQIGALVDNFENRFSSKLF